MRSESNLIYVSTVPVGSNVYKRIMRLKENSENILCKNIQIINVRIKPGQLVQFLKILFNRTINKVQVFEPFSLSFIFVIPFRIFGKTVIYNTGDLHYKTSELSKPKLPWRILISTSEHIHLYFSDLVMVGTETARKIFIRKFGLDDNRILVIPDGIDKISSEDHGGCNRKSDINRISILYSASLRYLHLNNETLSRGWELPLTAFILRNLGYNNFKITILGNGPGFKHLLELTQRLKVEDCVVCRWITD